jgi:DNA-directed RNA polymerase subunit RPC12/RpoP
MPSKDRVRRHDGRDLPEYSTPSRCPSSARRRRSLSANRRRCPSSRALRTRFSSRKNAMMWFCSWRSQPHNAMTNNSNGNTSEVYVSGARSSFETVRALTSHASHHRTRGVGKLYHLWQRACPGISCASCSSRCAGQDNCSRADREATMQTEYCCLKCKHYFEIGVTESELTARLNTGRSDSCPRCGQRVGIGPVRCRHCDCAFELSFPHWHVLCDLAVGECPACGTVYKSLFIDPEGYHAFIDAAEAELRQGRVH